VTARVRLRVFAVAALGLAALLIWAVRGLPGFGHYPGPYGDAVNGQAVQQRHTTDTVSAVNFDYRGVDTIGEEFILFVAATGVAVLLRAQRSEHEETGEPDDREAGQRVSSTSDAVRNLVLASVGPLAVLGIYIVSHGTISPGGGFQGGTVLATAFVAVYLAGQYIAVRRFEPVTANEVVEALGAAGYVAVGLAGLAAGGAFLVDILPLGTPGTIASGGTIALISFSVGLEVVAGFVLVIGEFLEQTLVRRAG
jgi:multicomponent Na+:H+ antiporter subunit B